MSYQIGTVTLPKSPTRISHTMPALSGVFKITGGTAVALGLGLDLETLSVNVTLHEQNYSLSQLSGSYLTPLKDYLNTEVEIAFPISIHNGTWLMTNIQHNINIDAPDRIFCVINFVKGSDILLM